MQQARKVVSFIVKILILILICLIISLANYLIITTIVDCVLMGKLHFCLSSRCRKKEFVITKENRIDIQSGYKCSAFSSAYVLRHWGIDEKGDTLYELIPNKMNDGYVYPKGIQSLLPKFGLRVNYRSGSLAALKNEVCKGNPVIVMLRVRPDKNWLHYVPVVGYDEENIFIAESLKELTNCSEEYYNRKVPIKEFKKLWNTAMLKMPLYRNTYITAQINK